MFDGTIDHSTSIPCFPCKTPPNAHLAANMTAIQQLELIARLQREWSDNSVSATVYFRPHELDGIRAYLMANYANSIKSISFMLHNDHGYAQAPYEEITREQYEEMAAAVRPIEYESMIDGGRAQIEYNRQDALIAVEADCPGGACPVR